MTSLLRYALSHNSIVKQLGSTRFEKPTVALCNPTVCEHNGELIYNIRGVNYGLWNSETETLNSCYGPLCYITNDNDIHLRTENYIGKLYQNTTKLNISSPERWEFVGLEDIRLVSWEGKLYATGVRRDYWYNGEGRMVLAEVDLNGGYKNEVVLEIENSGFCEKNWMPIIDRPFHYVRWVDPTQIVSVNPATGECNIVVERPISEDLKYVAFEGKQMRGSTQVLHIGDKYVALIHIVHLEYNDKREKCKACYKHQLVVWDEDWRVCYVSKPFSFAMFDIEFTVGWNYCNGLFYITFALQDNIPFCLEVSEEVFSGYFKEEGCNTEYTPTTLLECFFNDTKDSLFCFKLGMEYIDRNEYAAAGVLFERACEYRTFTDEYYYDSLYWCGRALAWTHNSNEHEEMMYTRMIDTNPKCSDGYFMMALYHFWRDNYRLAYTMSKMALDTGYWRNIDCVDGKILLCKCLYRTEEYKLVEGMLYNLIPECNNEQRKEIEAFLEMINDNKKNSYRLL
jgi:hypothetical protein